jgi:predicted esterase YcpF (UPF0227 family)
VNDYIYLHGFASSPKSAKAQDISDRFAEIDQKTRPEPMAFRHGDKSIATLVALERLTGFSYSGMMVKRSKNNHLREETS